MNTTENQIPKSQDTPAADLVSQLIKPLKSYVQPQEWKAVSLRECPTPSEMQIFDEPEQAAAYWRTHVVQHPYFNPDCENLVVLILNTRFRIKGHYLVSIGTMDSVLCHPRDLFKIAILASAAYLIVAHNLCVAANKLCYVVHSFM